MILDFILAALPWIICGIAVAVICVGNDQACSQKKQAMEEKHIGIGAGIGFAAGAVIAILVPEKGDHVIEKLREEEHMTVFLTTHYMEEAAAASYVVILDKGSIIAEGTPHELKEKYVEDTISLYGVTEEEVKSLGKPYKPIRDGYQLTVSSTLEATELIVTNRELFRDYEVVKGGMDDVFLAATGKVLGGDEK